jgi:hypothetical protein
MIAKIKITTHRSQCAGSGSRYRCAII